MNTEKDYFREYLTNWRKNNRDYCNQYRREYYAKNRDRVLAINKKSRERKKNMNNDNPNLKRITLLAEDERFKTVPLLFNLTEEQNREWQSKFLISNYGRIISKKSGKCLKLAQTQRGKYKVFATKIGGRTKSQKIIDDKHKGKDLCVRVHRLVAISFIPNTNGELKNVGHLDKDRNNNSARNLYWK